MSYTSNSVLGSDAKIKAVIEAVELLGYVRLRKEFDISNDPLKKVEDKKHFIKRHLKIYQKDTNPKERPLMKALKEEHAEDLLKEEKKFDILPEEEQNKLILGGA